MARSAQLAYTLLMTVAVICLFVGVVIARRRGRGRPGSGASGAVYELLNEDKRNAIEVIVEERAAARDPEEKEGDLPQLENPKRR